MAAGASKLLAVLAACSGVVALALWSTTSSESRDASAPLANAAEEPRPAENAPRSPAVALATSEESSSTRRVADKPEIVGTLIDSTTGLPLAGYTIELRPRVKPNARALMVQQLFVNSLSQPQRLVFSGSAGADYSFRVSLDSPSEGFRPGVDAPSIVIAQPVSVSFSKQPQLESKPDLSQVAWFAHRAALGASAGPRRLAFGVPEPATAPPESVPPSEAPDSSPTEERSPATDATSGSAVQLERPFLSLLEAPPPDGGQVELRAVMQRAAQTMQLTFEQRIDEPRRHRNLAHSPWSSVGETETKRTTTDAQGVFHFDCPEDPDVVLELVPHERDFFAKTSYTAIDPARLCQDEITWRVERGDGARVHGRVVDAQTLKPVAGLTLELRAQRGASATLVTDDDGRFTTDSNLPSGLVEWSAHDGDEETPVALEPREVRVPRAGEANDERVVLVGIGPTWRMSFQTSESAQIGGETTIESQEFPAAQVELRLLGAQPLAFAADETNPFARWRALREGESDGWVRYPRAVEWSRGGARVEFRSSDGSWTASMPIRPVGALTDLEGATIVLRRSARVTGIVKLGENGEDARELRVLACRTRDASSAYESSPCESCGSFVLEGLDPEAVHWLVVTRGETLVHVEELVLKPGDDRALEFEP